MLKVCLSAALLTALCLFSPHLAAAQALSTPPAVQASVERALALVSVRYQSRARRETDQAGQDFEQVLDEIGTQVSPALARQAAAAEGDSITAKIVLIAWDRQQRPQLYQEIDREYIHRIANPGGRAPHSPLVSQQHRAEAYRLPWEFFLMRPPSPVIAPRALDNGYTAISQLRNNNSLLTLVYLFQQTVHPAVELIDDLIPREQRLLRDTISDFHNPQGVEALLTCVALSDAQQAGLTGRKASAPPEQLQSFTNEFGWETHKELAEVLAQQQIEAGWWQRALAAYPAAGLTAGQKDLVEKVKKARIGPTTP